MSIITAAAVMGLVIDARRKIESMAIGAPSTAAEPTHDLSLVTRATSPTAPGIDPSLTYSVRRSWRPVMIMAA